MPQARRRRLRLAYFAGQSVNNHRRGVAGVIDKQFIATQMGLAHRDRELVFPASVKLAEAGVAITLRITLDVSSHRIDNVTCLRLISR